MAGILFDSKTGKGFVWSQDDDEPFGPEIYLERDSDGVILAIRDADLGVAMEFGARLAREANATVKQWATRYHCGQAGQYEGRRRQKIGSLSKNRQ